MTHSDSFNLYGDRLIPTTGTHGADISSQRVDELDKACLSFALAISRESAAIDIGCGMGIQGIRLALLGLETILIDVLDISRSIDAVSAVLGLGNLHFLLKDARTLTSADLPNSLTIAFSQRFVHFLRFNEADSLIETVAAKLAPNGRVFLSASGLRSELGDGYADREKPVDERFSPLAPNIAEKHGIREPVCLYAEKDLVFLAERHHLDIVDVWSSSFGNIKAIFKKC